MPVSKRPSHTLLYSQAGPSVIIAGWGLTAPAQSGRSVPAGPVRDRGASDIYSLEAFKHRFRPRPCGHTLAGAGSASTRILHEGNSRIWGRDGCGWACLFFFFPSLFINSYSSLLFYVHYLKNNNAKP